MKSSKKNLLGFTLLELLIVTVIASIILTIGFVSAQRILSNQRESASLHAFKQSIWQAATSANAQGASTKVMKSGNTLEIKHAITDQVLQSFELAKTVTTNLSDGEIIVFSASGKASTASLSALPSPIEITSSKKTYNLDVSLIGEVRVY